MTSLPAYIAVVDDERPVCTMLTRVLRLADYEVVTFASGEMFLASIEARAPACVVLDVHMPGLSGLDVQSELRTTGRHIPVIFITASDDPALGDVIAAAGGVTLLRKPFASSELLDAVGDALQRGQRDGP